MSASSKRVPGTMGRMRTFLFGVLASILLGAVPVGAQPAPGQSSRQDELDQLLAPIALYPDQLLSQILIASTYPLEVVQAERFLQQNPGLVGDALDQALSGQSWDPSVKSLAAFPQVLQMMSDKLEWTQRLGDAFLADEQGVMNTVQALRQRAAAAGNLQSTPQQAVSDQGGVIIIEPAQPQAVYVPVYDPWVVYGPWWAPAYPPWFWYPGPAYGYPAGVYIGAGIFFGAAWATGYHHWGWAHPDWRGHRINLHVQDNRFWNRPGGRPPPPPGQPWQHSPGHRRGVAYPDAATHERFNRVDPGAVRSRQSYRGFDRAPQVPEGGQPGAGFFRPERNAAPPTRPAPSARPAPNVAHPPQQAQPVTRMPVHPSAPTFDPGVSRQQAQANAQRGMQSRQSPGGMVPQGHAVRPSAPAPSSPSGRSAAPAPAPRAPAPRGGGTQKH
jgi:hypothetical protein